METIGWEWIASFFAAVTGQLIILIWYASRWKTESEYQSRMLCRLENDMAKLNSGFNSIHLDIVRLEGKIVSTIGRVESIERLHEAGANH